MGNYTNEVLTEALLEVSSTINKCEKMQGKFAEGTSQYSLLRNRIKAMYISKLLIVNEITKIEETLANRAGDVVTKMEVRQRKCYGVLHKRRINRSTPAYSFSY